MSESIGDAYDNPVKLVPTGEAFDQGPDAMWHESRPRTHIGYNPNHSYSDRMERPTPPGGVAVVDHVHIYLSYAGQPMACIHCGRRQGQCER